MRVSTFIIRYFYIQRNSKDIITKKNPIFYHNFNYKLNSLFYMAGIFGIVQIRNVLVST